MENFSDILKCFGICSDNIISERINTGHINDTYKIYSGNGIYILQKINTDVFRNPEMVMHNIEYAQNMIKNADNEYPCYLKSDNKNYLLRNGFWRIYPFIESVNIFPDKITVRSFGKLLGEFHRYTESADIFRLYITIPDFHNIEKNITSLLQIDIQEEFFNDFLEFYKKEKVLLSPPRLVHNDVKWANVLINPETLQPYALIDYDTIMPGHAAFDFGDAVRSACVTSNNEIDIDMLGGFSKGYFTEYGGIDAQEAALGILSVTAELSSRYLYDFLNRNNYFANLSADEKIEKYTSNLSLAKNILNMYGEITETISRQSEMHHISEK